MTNSCEKCDAELKNCPCRNPEDAEGMLAEIGKNAHGTLRFYGNAYDVRLVAVKCEGNPYHQSRFADGAGMASTLHKGTVRRRFILEETFHME